MAVKLSLELLPILLSKGRTVESYRSFEERIGEVSERKWGCYVGGRVG